MTETTVDFVIRLKDGTYYPKSRHVTKALRHHLNAMSFSIRNQAELVGKHHPGSRVVKRTCTLEDREEQ